MQNRESLLNRNKYRAWIHNRRSQNNLAQNSRLQPLPQLQSHLVDNSLHPISFGLVRHASKRRPGIFRHVRGIAGLGKDAGDRRMRQDIFQGKLRPALAIELGSPLGYGSISKFAEILTIHERPVDDHRDTAVLAHRQQPLFCTSLRDRVVDLHEVRPFASQEPLEIFVQSVSRDRHTYVARLSRCLPVLEIRPLRIEVGQTEDLNQIQSFSMIKALGLAKLLDTRIPPNLIDLAGHEQ